MRIGYFADGPWSHKAFELMIADKDLLIQFIVPRRDTKDQVLIQYAEKHQIDIINDVKVNSQEFYELAKTYNCDLFVSMSYNQIFKERITTLPPLGTINCHAGKLPFYRGRNILNWALINDEKEFGITVHYIDNSIDTGDIILQRNFPITDKDDYFSLLNISYNECAVILYDSLKMIQRGTVSTIAQNSIHPVGSYFGVRKEGDEKIDWNQSSREVFNFIRAICLPGPRARGFCGEAEIFINKAAIVPNAPAYKCFNGMITGKTDRGY
ncbi:MAG: methionyl-tRNA formyltransferase, partial [Flavisolibacter sp.]